MKDAGQRAGVARGLVYQHVAAVGADVEERAHRAVFATHQDQVLARGVLEGPVVVDPHYVDKRLYTDAALLG